MISRLLVANRGEIARRVILACRQHGVSPAAVYSDADADAAFVSEADVAVRLPGVSPTDTYLRIDSVVAAAVACGADAVHPGYGFLSENAEFARAVQAAGLTWVGPSPESIDAMGSKVAAKKLVSAAGVPVLDELDPAAVTAADLPILVKASAGGGGRGMREVHRLDELTEAVAAAKREAASAFGDAEVFCEPLLTGAHHVEVQLLADTHGTIWTLTERDCSLQRRHQKIIEESPSPVVDAATRARLHDAARAAAEAIGYVGAGTVEFLLGADGRLAFLEVNTRLQVEHPVTEAVHGLDLVGWQFSIAEGAALPAQPPPASGSLHRFHIPDVDTEFTVPAGEHGLRCDSGVRSGDVIGVHYDPMLAKLIAHGPDRTSAVRRLTAALRGAQLHGVTTNRELLLGLLGNDEFLAGGCDTGYLDRNEAGRLSVQPTEEAVQISALAAAIALAEQHHASSVVDAALPTGWRNLRSQPNLTTFSYQDDPLEVRHSIRRGVLSSDLDAELLYAAPNQVTLRLGPVTHRFAVSTYGTRVEVDSTLGAVSLTLVPALPEPSEKLAAGAMVAPMPGSVIRVSVQAGQQVEAGAEILVLEAMKMEHRVLAPEAGEVTDIAVTRGQQVEAGAVLAVITGGQS